MGGGGGRKEGKKTFFSQQLPSQVKISFCFIGGSALYDFYPCLVPGLLFKIY
jgi:hypothetical protein